MSTRTTSLCGSVRLGAAALAALASVLLGAAAYAQTVEEGDALLVAEDYSGAQSTYEAVLATEPENANAAYGLARAHQEQGQLDEAAAQFDSAEELNFQPLPRLQYHRARLAMARGDEETALSQIEAIAAAGAPLATTIEAAAEFAPLAENERFQAAVQAMRPCFGPEYRQFDFWLGEWTVTSPGAVAANSITSAQGGCVVLEQYTAGAFTGVSLNFYDSVTGRWHQTWMSNAGGAVYLEGGLDESGAMMMSDAELPVSEVTGSVNRVTWTPQGDGSVRQHWEQTTDDGETWSTVFDGMYTPAEDVAAEPPGE